MSQDTQSLLIELGTEELPPKALKSLASAFSETLSESLRSAGMRGSNSQTRSYASPRRLAVWISEVIACQDDFSQTRKGPAVSAAFDGNGDPTRAALGFAKSCGVEISDLGREKTAQGEWLSFQQNIVGKSITQCAQDALHAAIRQLPIPRRMRWGDNDAEFVRPAHWLLALYGESTLALSALGLEAGNTSRGHRYHHPGPISIESADDYVGKLEQAFVLADYAQRQETIREQAKSLAKMEGGAVVLDPALLDEVTSLVEYPVAMLGHFDPAFLEVPREALVASMKDHQKYFHLEGPGSELLPAFITVSNIRSTSPEKVRCGNERVLQARLSDAQFFWEQDLQHPLQDHATRLENLLFHIKLGSMADKTRRLESVAARLAELIDADVHATSRAASLCKLDLLSLMVGEFASLQGTMGRYYARHQGEPEPVAQAIEQHYWPRFSGDHLPQSAVATALALADKIDTLVGIFASGEKPSGDKDPYALRRAALGILRMLIEKDLDVSLDTLIEISAMAYQQTPGLNVKLDTKTQQEIRQFMLDRLRAHYTGAGIDIHVFNAVAETRPSSISDFDRRVDAIGDFFNTEKTAARSLAAANKRIANILRKSAISMAEYDPALFQEAAEKRLAETLQSLREPVLTAFSGQQYAQGLTRLAELEAPVNDFFDQVRVMDDDETIRNNRLGLLGSLRQLFLQVADISYLNLEN